MEELTTCRCCMKEFVKNRTDCYNIELVAKYYFCTNIVISESDKITKQFCCDCIHKIERTYNFIKEAQRVDKLLNNDWANSKNKFTNKKDTNVHFEQYNCEVINRPFLTVKNISNTDEMLCEKGDFNDLNYEDMDNTQESIDYNQVEFTSTIMNTENLSLTEKSSSLSNSLSPIEELSNSDQYEEAMRDSTNNTVEIMNNSSKLLHPACELCNKVFKTKKAYNAHMMIHYLKKIVCDRCNKEFQSLYKLRAHRYICVKENYEVECVQCGLKFRNQTKLKLHITSKHSEERPYSCHICSKRFKFKRILEQHIGIHSAVKPFLCEVCGLNMSQANTLKEHIKTHTKEMSYECNECNFQTTRLFSLNRHKLLHTGQRSHQCTLCGQKFYGSFELKQHMRKHTGELPYNCPLCDGKFINSTKRKEHIVRSHKIALCDIPRMNKNGDTLLNYPVKV